ncbi:MAG: sugar phosphate isomerase/epimerase [Chloroflexi bacterium]|nr:sugar phosphate isomerase/epimerase [Chloroflexota bacterium]HEV8053333.1 sugar phosphate isomerase/epimerase [Candidatus Limnocylindrales bacterium]
MKSSQIGLQLYTVREAAGRDMVGTIRRIGELGYGAVELAGYGNAAPREIRTALDGEGIVVAGVHVPFVDLEIRPMQVLGECQLLGAEYAVIPSVPDSWRESGDAVRRLGERLDSVGRLCEAEGLRLAYHNHADEFLPPGAAGPAAPSGPASVTTWDLLVRGTSPELVDFELDCYWAAFAGVQPAEAIDQAAGRVRLLHLKDMSADESRADAPVGDGTLPWPAVLESAERAGVRWYIVEQDTPAAPFANVQRSLLNLRQLAGLPLAAS